MDQTPAETPISSVEKLPEETTEDTKVQLSYDELKTLTDITINDLLSKEPTFQDLPNDITLEEIDAQIAVIHGKSMTIYVIREDGRVDIPIIVKKENSTVADLKRAFRRNMDLRLPREGENVKISWKRFWRVYCFSYEGLKLNDDNCLLSEYGISNKCRIRTVKKVKEKLNVNSKRR